MKDMYMTYEMVIAPKVPRGIAVAGSIRLPARLAPERMPVKHGKKTARALLKLSQRGAIRDET
eukprot:6556902-Prymnesium_polylepis.1